MMGRTHYTIGVLYYLLFCMIPIFTVIEFSDFSNMIVCILAAAIGAVFPDADSDHSLINSRNPVFKTSNKVVNHYKQLLKKVFAFIFFSIPAFIIGIYMYRNGRYPIGLLVFVFILLIMSMKGSSIGEKIYIPILTEGLKAINTGASRIKKVFMMLIYFGVGIACIYFGKGNIQALIWGLIFIVIAIFPHRTFLHSPEGLILVTVGVKFLQEKIMIPNISTAFFIGYFSHLYLADIFTNSGVPLSVLPLILKKIRIHDVLKKSKIYMVLYNILDTKLAIPLVKTGSKLGSIIEGIYVFILFVLVFFIMIKNRVL
jgi:hypothetical protein